LLGAAHHLREKMALPVLPVDPEDNQQGVARLREEMGPQAFQQSWKAETGVVVGDCIEYALAEG
jgi:hypothetical protein